MLTSKLFSIALIVLSVIGIGNSTEVCFDFKSDPYFKVTSIERNNDAITFNDISNTEPCNLVLKSSDKFNPILILNCMDNKVKFSRFRVSNNIKSLDVKATGDYQVEIQKLEAMSSANVKIDGKIIVKNFFIGAGSKVIFTDGSKVVIG